jgi:hypothetical protein
LNENEIWYDKIKNNGKKKIIQIEEKQVQIKEEKKKFREWWIKQE